MRSGRVHIASAVAAVAIVYFAAAKLGFTMAFAAEQVTVVWPPTGLALTAVLLLGQRVWPGILLGAFAANVTTREPIAVAAAIAIGNTSEALVAAWLLTRMMQFRASLTRLKDVLGLVLFGAALSPFVSAAVGVTSLCLGGVQPWQHYGSLLFVWWLGDAMGDLLVAPILLTWASRQGPRWTTAQFLELAVAMLMILAIGSVVFAGWLPTFMPHNHFGYAVFPFVIWVALRFDQRGATLATLTIAAVATWGTTNGFGPFAQGTTHESLILLQSFNAVVAITGLVLAATTTARKSAERYRDIGYAITRILAESTRLSDAENRILATVCETLGWQVGAMWSVDQQAQELRCTAFWRSPTTAASPFETMTRRCTFGPGIGLPGRVWSSGRPAWVEDVVYDNNFPRAAVAAQEGLHGAFAFPIMLGTTLIGVIEFFSHRIEEPNNDLLQVMATIGGQIGQVMERKRIESAIQESEARKTAILESALDAIVTMDYQGTIVEFNPAAERLFGYTRAAVVGKKMVELIVPPHLRGAHTEGLAHYLATGEGAVIGTRLEMTGMRFDGTEFPVELAIARIPLGAPPMFTGYIRDITDAKQLREELRQQAEQLVHAARRKDEFLAMLSHELRNPLAPIRTAVEAIARLPPGDPKLRWACDVAQRQVHHMARLIDDLLDISRITTGQITLKKETTDLASVLTQAIETSRPLIDAHHHQLAVSIPSAPLQLDADPSRLQQVFANLLNNAAKYTDEHGHIWLTAESKPSEVIVRVRDDGMGIAAERLPRIFDPFSQTDRSLDRSQGGLGIGLSVVRYLVELHHGFVEAFSGGLGQGSEFLVHLPILPQAQSAPNDPLRPLTAPANGTASPAFRILVVDDNVDAAESLSLLLTLMGHDVRTAHDGPTALETAQHYPPDIVFLDIGLPGMDGYAVSRGMRAHADLKDAFIVALTGYGQQSDRQSSAEAGFDQHLVKPVDVDAVLAILSSREAASRHSK